MSDPSISHLCNLHSHYCFLKWFSSLVLNPPRLSFLWCFLAKIMEAVCSPPFLTTLVSSTVVISDSGMQTDRKYRVHECKFVCFPLDNEIFVGSLCIVTRLRDVLRRSALRFRQGPTMGLLWKRPGRLWGLVSCWMGIGGSFPGIKAAGLKTWSLVPF
jgi:hypothetical protein